MSSSKWARYCRVGFVAGLGPLSLVTAPTVAQVSEADAANAATQQSYIDMYEGVLSHLVRLQERGMCGPFAQLDGLFIDEVRAMDGTRVGPPEWELGYQSRYRDVKHRGCTPAPAPSPAEPAELDPARANEEIEHIESWTASLADMVASRRCAEAKEIYRTAIYDLDASPLPASSKAVLRQRLDAAHAQPCPPAASGPAASPPVDAEWTDVSRPAPLEPPPGMIPTAQSSPPASAPIAVPASAPVSAPGGAVFAVAPASAPPPPRADAVAPSEEDSLGSEWSERESNWIGRWVRRGKTSTFDATWTRDGEEVEGILTIDIVGNHVTIDRSNASDGNNCQYEGILSGDSVSGSRRCKSGGGPWSATIRRVADVPGAAPSAASSAASSSAGPLPSQPAGCVGFAGTWDVNKSTFELTQDGNVVVGTYGGGPGKIRGRVSADGRTFIGEESSWVEPDKWLDVVIRVELSDDGQSFVGTSRSPDLTVITVLNGRCKGTADQLLTATLEAIVAADSRGWRTNRYVVGTIRNGRVYAGDRDSANFSARGEYTYNGDRSGWVIARFRNGQLECLQYHDIGDTCRLPH
jgi:hypothetical protein